ncbi:MAG TPA: hypothetical protein VFP36_07390 [Usitatibacter sp.]|nr:hypothetical protein [Usitatibacter sp.]
MKLPTAEDGEITYRVDNVAKQALNAKDDRAETLPVVLAFVPRKPNAPMQWTFVYRVSFSGKVKPVSIRVETENQKPLALEVEDRKPALEAGLWSGSVAPIEFNRFWAEKIAAKDPWMLQRRYTIVYADGRKSVLHQLSILTAESRAQILESMR